MQNTLSNLLSSSLNAEYCDIRFDDRKITEIYADLSHIQVTCTLNSGFHLREYHDGRWKSKVFSHINGLLKNKEKISIKRSHRKITNYIPDKLNRSIKLNVPNRLSQTSLEIKIQTLKDYMSLISHYSKITGASIFYREESCHKYFLNCKERYIEQEQENALGIIDLAVNLNKGVRAGTDVLNSCGSFDSFLNHEIRIEKLLSFISEPVTGCPFINEPVTIICTPQLSSSLIHETIGHALEADYNPQTPTVKEQLQPGVETLSPLLTIIDDPGLEGKSGSYFYDDEGMEAKRKVLVENGCIKSKLHNLCTAFNHGVSSTGNGRAVGFEYFPIVRMSNFYAKEGEQSLGEMIESTPRGLMLDGLRGGRVEGDSFIYQVNGGNMIVDGRITQPVGNMVIESKILTFLQNIKMVGNSNYSDYSAYCVKEGQAFLPLWNGATHLMIDNMHVRYV